MLDSNASCETLKLPAITTDHGYGYGGAFVPYIWANTDILFDRFCIWTDGTDIYHSCDNTHYKLNKETRLWESVNWSSEGDISRGRYIWSDGTDIYYSHINTQLKFIKEQGTWVTKEWGSAYPSYGNCVWTDGTDIYYISSGTEGLVLNGGVWESITFNHYVRGECIWTDGVNIYFTDSNGSQKFNKDDKSWEDYRFSNTPYSLSGENIWSDGVSIYYSKGINTSQTNRRLNIETNTWEPIEIKGRNFDGGGVWSDGKYTYYANNILLPFTARVYSRTDHYTWSAIASVSNGISFNISGTKYYADKGMLWWEWIDSEYNTDSRYILMESEIWDTVTSQYVCLSDGSHVGSAAEITHGSVYILGT